MPIELEMVINSGQSGYISKPQKIIQKQNLFFSVTPKQTLITLESSNDGIKLLQMLLCNSWGRLSDDAQ